MSAYDECHRLNIEKCSDCNCNLGDDWEYKDFSNRTIVICPQCKTEIYLNDYYGVN